MSFSENSVNFTNFVEETLTTTMDQRNLTQFDYIMSSFVTGLNFFYTPILVIMGTLGNLISILVFYKSKMRVQSTSQYLTSLACSDTIFLFQLIPPWLNAIDSSDLFHAEGFCQIFVYVSYVTCCMSSWIIVAFTVERFVAVSYPLQRNKLCTTARSRYITFILFLFSVLVNIPILRFAKPSNNDCNIDIDYIEPAGQFNWIDTTVSFSLPMGIILVLNVGIIIGIYRLERTRLMLIKHLTPENKTKLAMLMCPRSQSRVTRMLLIVSSVFVFLNLPAYAMRVVAYSSPGVITSDANGRWAAFQQVALMCFNTNYGINFLLYCMSGQTFRRELRDAIPQVLRRDERRPDAVRRNTGFHSNRVNSITLSFATDATNTVQTPCPSRHYRTEAEIPWPRHQELPYEDIEMEIFTPETYTCRGFKRSADSGFNCPPKHKKTIKKKMNIEHFWHE